MKTSIQSIRRFGGYYHVALACGHRYVATSYIIDRDQLYIGKNVECTESHIEEDDDNDQ